MREVSTSASVTNRTTEPFTQLRTGPSLPELHNHQTSCSSQVIYCV